MTTRGPDEHARFRLLAAAAVDGWIEPDEAAELDAHLAGCPACRADQAAMAEDHRWLATPSHVAAPATWVRTNVLGAARAPGVPRIGAPARPWSVLLAAGLVVALVTTGVLLGQRPTSPGAAPSSPSPSPSATTAASTPMTPLPLTRLMPSGPCSPQFDGLAAWWQGEPDGREAVARRDATLRPGAASTAGVVGSAFDFDGLLGYAEVKADAALAFGTDDFTILLWVRFDDPAEERVLIEQWLEAGLPSSGTKGWTLTKLADGVLLFTSEVSHAGQGGSTGVLGFEPGVWYHVAVRRARSTYTLFVNGTEVGGGDSAEPPLDLRLDNPILLGRRGDDRGFLLDGGLDEVQFVIGRALFANEIRAQYLAGSNGTCSA